MYKKFIAIGLITLFSSTLHAEYTDVERIRDMKTMEEAMVKIQKGLLINDSNMLSKGVNQLQQVTRKVEPPIDSNSVLAQKNTHKYKFSRKQGEKIIQFAEDIRADMDAGNKHSASKSFVKVLDECISCHNKIRKWQDK
jgi:cytochrome c556